MTPPENSLPLFFRRPRFCREYSVLMFLCLYAFCCGSVIFTARCYASAVLAMALCPSVCPSVTSRCSTKTAKRRITQKTSHDSSFRTPKISAKFHRDHPLRGRQIQVGWVKIGDFRQITGYISKTVQDRRMVSIKVE